MPSCSSSSRRMRRSRAGSNSRANASRTRACRRASAGWATAIARRRAWRSTNWCAAAQLKAPIVIGRDHLDTGSVASPYRETEAMKDGSDAIADWPILNALLNTAAGAHWVSFHHGGGVGIGYSLHAGMVVVADGSEDAARAPGLRADDRLRDGRRPPRRCRLRDRDRNRRREGHRLAALIVRARDDRHVRRRHGAKAASLSTIWDASTMARSWSRTARVAAVGQREQIEAALAVAKSKNSICATAWSFRASSTRTRIRSSPAIASRILPRGCAARGRRSGCSTRSSRRARRCWIRRVLRRHRSRRDLRTMLAHGTTTLETKTGYALHKPGETELLDIIAAHRDDAGVPRLIATFLRRARAAAGVYARRGVHRLPDRSGDAVGGGARRGLRRRVLRAGILFAGADAPLSGCRAPQRHAPARALRRDGVRRGRGDGGAAGVDAVDHCNYIRDEDVRAIAERGIVTVACPATIAYLDLQRRAPVRALLEAGGAVALASDYNPGTSPCFNLQTVAYFGRKLFGLIGGRGALRRDARGGAFAARRCGSLAGRRRAPISSRCRSRRRTSSAGSSAAICAARRRDKRGVRCVEHDKRAGALRARAGGRGAATRTSPSSCATARS